MYYHFDQNNSGGSMLLDSEGCEEYVIEADSSEEANEIAIQKVGIYFNGCENGSDCYCCGDRWTAVDKSDGERKPIKFGEVIEFDNNNISINKHGYEGKIKLIKKDK